MEMSIGLIIGVVLVVAIVAGAYFVFGKKRGKKDVKAPKAPTV